MKRKAVELALISTGVCMMFGFPSGLIGAVIAFAAWEIGERWLLSRA